MRKRPAKPRNRARYRDHFKYSVQWLIAFEDNHEHPQCCAAFLTLREAEWFANWLCARQPYYGVEVIPL